MWAAGTKATVMMHQVFFLCLKPINHRPSFFAILLKMKVIVGIRRPEDQSHSAAGPGQPWSGFLSMATMAAVLSEDNRALLRIREQRPKSLTALAALTGGARPTGQRPLRMMEGYGLVRFKR